MNSNTEETYLSIPCESQVVTDEKQYLDIVKDVLENGTWKEGRNGRTKEVFGRMLRFSLSDNKLPLLTTKHVSWKTVLKELIFFIRGQSDNRILNKQGVHIWDGNSTREFLDSRGLTEYPEGILGNIYGFQWRNFNGKYDICKCSLIESPSQLCNCNSLEKEGRIDQLQNVIDKLKNPDKRNDRRLIVSAWNPCQIDKMALPPCHLMFQFNVTDCNKLSCLMTQRSADIGLGLPYNIASYAILTHLIAHHCGLEAHELILSIGSAHIYEQHIPQLTEQLTREPRLFSTLTIVNLKEKIEEYNVSDFKVFNYNPHPVIKMEFVA